MSRQTLSQRKALHRKPFVLPPFKIRRDPHLNARLSEVGRTTASAERILEATPCLKALYEFLARK